MGVEVIDDVLDEAVGRRHRPDPVVGRTSGPAGNAQLTAWTGLLLLVLIVVELVTLIDVRGMLSWHVVVGVLLVAVAALKIASTTWRFLRYYARHRPYAQAGPPPTLLRLLGPLVVASTVGVLGSGLWLIAVGADAGRNALFTVLGQGVDLVTIHQGFFIAFAVVTGLHVLARLVPAYFLATGRAQRTATGGGRLRGWGPRAAILVATLVAGALAAALILPAASSWQQERREFRDFPPPGASSDHG